MVVLSQASFDLAVPKHLHSALIGKEGKIVKELMEATSTTIRIPKSDDPSNLISVSGTTENIRAAIEKIQLLADEKVRSHRFTSIHFTTAFTSSHAFRAKLTWQCLYFQDKLDFVRLPIIKAFHALIAGHQNSNVKRISETNGVRVHLPPYNVVRVRTRSRFVLSLPSHSLLYRMRSWCLVRRPVSPRLSLRSTPSTSKRYIIATSPCLFHHHPYLVRLISALDLR